MSVMHVMTMNGVNVWTPYLYTIVEPQAISSNLLAYVQHIWMSEYDEPYLSLHPAI